MIKIFMFVFVYIRKNMLICPSVGNTVIEKEAISNVELIHSELFLHCL